MVTSIQLDNKTKSKLDKLKVFPKETYDDVVQRLINIVEDDQGVLSQQTVKNIEEGLADIKAGRVYASEQVKKKLGLS